MSILRLRSSRLSVQKGRKILEIRISYIASAGFSGIIQQKLPQWSPGLLDLFHHTCKIFVAMFIDIDISPTLSTSL